MKGPEYKDSADTSHNPILVGKSSISNDARILLLGREGCRGSGEPRSDFISIYLSSEHGTGYELMIASTIQQLCLPQLSQRYR